MAESVEVSRDYAELGIHCDHLYTVLKREDIDALTLEEAGTALQEGQITLENYSTLWIAALVEHYGIAQIGRLLQG